MALSSLPSTYEIARIPASRTRSISGPKRAYFRAFASDHQPQLQNKVAFVLQALSGKLDIAILCHTRNQFSTWQCIDLIGDLQKLFSDIGRVDVESLLDGEQDFVVSD